MSSNILREVFYDESLKIVHLATWVSIMLAKRYELLLSIRVPGGNILTQMSTPYILYSGHLRSDMKRSFKISTSIYVSDH